MQYFLINKFRKHWVFYVIPGSMWTRVEGDYVSRMDQFERGQDEAVDGRQRSFSNAMNEKAAYEGSKGFVRIVEPFKFCYLDILCEV